MEIYWIAVLISLCLSFVLTSQNVKISDGRFGKITLTRVWMAFIPLFLLAFFRWNVGVDVVYGTGYYYIEYSAIQMGKGNVFGYEIGFYLLMELCNALHLNLYCFYCISTVVFFVLFIKFLISNTNNITLAILIFFLSDLYLFTFSTLRQSLAIAFFLYPMAEVIKGNKFVSNWKFWIYAIISVSMHISIIYLIIVLLVSRIRFRKNTFFLIAIFGFIATPLIRIALEKLISYNYYFAKYFNTNEYGSEFTPTYFFVTLIFLIPMCVFYNKFIEKDDKNYIFVNLSLFFVLLMLNSQVLIMPYRIFPLFVPAYIMLIPNFIESLKLKKSGKALMYLYYILPLLFLFANTYSSSSIYEYKSIFEYTHQVW